jgi:hypothetical protein
MSDLNDMMARLVGVDHTNEIFNIWYELTFLRVIYSKFLEQNPAFLEKMSPEILDQCRNESKRIVQMKFPKVPLQFNSPKEIHKENEQKTPITNIEKENP